MRRRLKKGWLTVGWHLKNITHEECHLVFHPEKESMHYSQHPRCGNNLNVPQWRKGSIYIQEYCVFVLSSSVVSNSLWTHRLQPTRLLYPWGFSRQEYWSGLPCPPPGDLPHPGIEPRSPTLQAESLLSEQPGKLHNAYDSALKNKRKSCHILCGWTWRALCNVK